LPSRFNEGMLIIGGVEVDQPGIRHGYRIEDKIYIILDFDVAGYGIILKYEVRIDTNVNMLLEHFIRAEQGNEIWG